MADFEKLPSHVLEQIALELACTDLDRIGPPSQILPLLYTSKSIYHHLCITRNSTLYARLFKEWFDQPTLLSTLFPHTQPNPLLAHEFCTRFRAMSWFKDTETSLFTSTNSQINSDLISTYLWTAYLMSLEDRGRNRSHMQKYARLYPWVHSYLFDTNGASGVHNIIEAKGWPEDTPSLRLALWLLWFTLDSETLSPEAQLDLKVFAMGAHKYTTCDLPWEAMDSFQNGTDLNKSDVHIYGNVFQCIPPPISTSSSLMFMATVSFDHVGYHQAALTMPLPRHLDQLEPDVAPVSQWAAECQRLLGLRTARLLHGSFDGAWEGPFNYIDFHEFLDLRDGASPQILQESYLAQGDQLWNLREYHLVEDSSGEFSNIPLTFGPPLNGSFPTGCRIDDRRQYAVFQEAGRDRPVRYTRWNPEIVESLDILVLGEGASNWGRFVLRGRVRREDGFMNLVKEYSEGPRGRWLYRGYIVGYPDGNLVGRWRDTITPSHEQGYEGCYGLRRRV